MADSYDRGTDGRIILEPPNGIYEGRFKSPLSYFYGYVPAVPLISDYTISLNVGALVSEVQLRARRLDIMNSRLNSGTLGSLQNVTQQNINAARSLSYLDVFSLTIDHEFSHYLHPWFQHGSLEQKTQVLSDPVYTAATTDLRMVGGYYVGQNGIVHNSVSTVNNFLNETSIDTATEYSSGAGGMRLISNVNRQAEYEQAKSALAQDPDVALSTMASVFGSTLGRLIGESDLVLGTAAGAVAATIALELGRTISAASKVSFSKAVFGPESPWADFGSHLGQFGANAAIGSVSSYLAAEIAQSIGMHGLVGETFSLATGSVLQYYATTALANSSVGCCQTNVAGRGGGW